MSGPSLYSPVGPSSKSSPAPTSARPDSSRSLASVCLGSAEYLTVREVVKLRRVSREWRTAVDEHWLKRCVAKGGVLASERAAFWLHYCGNVSVLLAEKRRTLGDPHLSLHAVFDHFRATALSPNQTGEIARDVSRTMPTNARFQCVSGQGELQQVLHAVVASEPTVGYCQGMNFVAAVLLLHLETPCLAFWMMLVLLRFYHYHFLFAPAVPLLPLRMYQFSQLVKRELPALWHHLHSHTFSVEVIAHQWIMTLFGYFVEPQFLASIWDLFFLQGWKVVFKCGLTLLKVMEAKLLRLEVERVSHFLQLDSVRNSPAELWRIATEFKVTNRMLHSLAHHYQTEKLLKAAHECQPLFRGVRPERLPHLTVHGFSLASAGPLALFIDIAGLTTFNAPLEGVRHEDDAVRLSPVVRRLRRKPPVETPLCLLAQTKVALPLATLAAVLQQLQLVEDAAAADMQMLQHKLLGVEREFTEIQKRRDAQIGRHEEVCRHFAHVADNKRRIQNHLQTLVSSGLAEAKSKAAAGMTFLSFPSVQLRGSRQMQLPNEVPAVLQLMVETEKEFYEKKQLLDSERVELETADAEYNEVAQVKNLYIKQLLDFSLQTERTVHETVWRSLNGAVHAFAACTASPSPN